MNDETRPTTKPAREVPRRNYAPDPPPVDDPRKLLDLAMDDLDGRAGPERDAIVRVVAALDRILRRIDKLDREISGLSIAVMGHAAVDAFARYAIGVDALPPAPGRPAKRGGRT